MFTASMMVAALISGMIVLFCIQQFVEHSRTPEKRPKGDGIDKTDLHNRMIAKHNQIQQLNAALSQRDHITVSDLMTTQLTVVRNDAPVSEVRHLMTTHRTRHLLVQDENSLLVGIISDRDLAKRARGRADDIMTRDPATVTPNCPISDAVGLVLSKRVSCLPVVDHGHLSGVMTSTDLLVILECLLEDYEKSAHAAGRRTCTHDHNSYLDESSVVEGNSVVEATVIEPEDQAPIDAQPVS